MKIKIKIQIMQKIKKQNIKKIKNNKIVIIIKDAVNSKKKERKIKSLIKKCEKGK